jgi:superfamily II DNA/RNA helicase
MQQSDRDQVMDEFRNGKLKLLISTDIMARGIDVDSLTHVFNYSPPADPESYIHRIGRTARKGETGTAITFFNPGEKRALDALERRVKMPLEKHPDSTTEFDPALAGRQGRSGRGRGQYGASGGGPGNNPKGGHKGGRRPHQGRRKSGEKAVPATAHVDGQTPSG